MSLTDSPAPSAADTLTTLEGRIARCETVTRLLGLADLPGTVQLAEHECTLTEDGRKLGRALLTKNDPGACDNLATGVSRWTGHRTATAPTVGFLTTDGREVLHDKIVAFIARVLCVNAGSACSPRLLCSAIRCYPYMKKRRHDRSNSLVRESVIPQGGPTTYDAYIEMRVTWPCFVVAY